MTEARLVNALRRHRERLGLSQQKVAELVGVSRQAIVAIEGGRQVPSTGLALRLAGALNCRVEDLFSLRDASGLTAELAPGEGHGSRAASGAHSERVALAEIAGRWVAHRLPPDPTLAADGLITGLSGPNAVTVRPLFDPVQLQRQVIVSGCAPVLGSLARHVGRLSVNRRTTWLSTNTRQSLELLQQGFVHLAGIHLSDSTDGTGNVRAVRLSFPGQRMLVVNVTRWRQGFVLSKGRRRSLGTGLGLLHPGVRVARREEGSAAHELLAVQLEREGIENTALRGPLALSHAEVAQLVRCGAADLGISIEGEALAAGLDFVPLSEERFDLVLPASLADTPHVSEVLQTLSESGFRSELAHLPGYDRDLTGHVTTVEAA